MDHKKTTMVKVSQRLDFETAAYELIKGIPTSAKNIFVHYVTNDVNLREKVGKIEVVGVLRYVKYHGPTHNHFIGNMWVEYDVLENKEELFSSIHG